MKQYYLPDLGETAKDSRPIPGSDGWDHEDCARYAAELFHDQGDGWECEWPVVIAIVEDNKEVCRFRVDREVTHEFYPTMI